MEPSSSVRVRKAHITISSETNNLADLYPHDLSLFKTPPKNTIQIDEFETLALERVQLFRIIEEATIKKFKPHTKDWRNCIREDLIKSDLKKYVRLMSGNNGNSEQDYQARRADHLSHFILRIAYCRSEDLRRYFLMKELDWLKIKFSEQNSRSIKTFLQINNINYIPITNDEKEQIKDKLIETNSLISVESTDFYKVYFSEVQPLVKARKVFLKLQYAYITPMDLISPIQSKFRTFLSEALISYFHKLPSFSDERINDLLINLHTLHTGNNYNYEPMEKEGVDPSSLDKFSKKHFPPCMRHLHELLKMNHHLKHGARLQYRLFLKGIGLSYEDAVKFWREELTKKPEIDDNKFEKEYLYDIKHAYGQVGRRISYSPFSCIKIITGSIGGGEQHGCPFKHWDVGVIKQKALEQGLASEYVRDIEDLAKNGHCQLACAKYFEATHGKPPSNGINHPNQYFEESLSLEKNQQINTS